MTLEEYLIIKTEGETFLKDVEVIKFSVEDETLYLYYKIGDKPKKLNLNHVTSMSDEYEHQLWCDMLGRGYVLIYVEGGWLVKGPNNTYELQEDSCTCPASTHKPDIKCKHLMFRDAELRYRSKQSSYRSSLSFHGGT